MTRFGRLIVNTRPANLEIYLDGMPVLDSLGRIVKSPTMILNVSEGIHNITFSKDGYITASNTVQQEKNQKILQLKNIEKTSSAEDIIKLKAEIFDIILRREEYMAVANELQQTKAQKLQQLANAQKEQQSQNIPKQPDIKQPL